MKSSHSLSLGCWCGLAISLYTIRRLCKFIVLQKAVNCCCDSWAKYVGETTDKNLDVDFGCVIVLLIVQ